MDLTIEEVEILKHTNKSPNRAYCGAKDDETLIGLCKKGLMSGPIKSFILPPTDAYFKISSKGIKSIQNK